MTLGRTNINLTEIPVGYEQLVNYVLLYNEGVEDTTISGGMSGTTNAGGKVTENTTNVYIGNSTTSNSACGYLSVNAIDLAPYSMLAVNTKWVSGLTSHFLAAVMSSRTFTWSNYADNVIKNTGVDYTGEMSITNLDLSDVTESGYVGVSGYSNHTGMYHYVYNIALVKADGWATLAEKAGITASSIDDILTASSTLLANKDAVNFMVKQCTGDFMASAVASETFLTALNSSPYKSVVQGNEHWAKFLAMVA